MQNYQTKSKWQHENNYSELNSSQLHHSFLNLNQQQEFEIFHCDYDTILQTTTQEKTINMSLIFIAQNYFRWNRNWFPRLEQQDKHFDWYTHLHDLSNPPVM